MATARRSATNENISTYGDGTRDYTSLDTWEAATDIDLVTATQSEVLECYKDSAEYDDNTDMNGAIASALYFRIIRPAAGQAHTGQPNTGVRFNSTDSVSNFAIRLREDYISVYDIEARCTTNSASNDYCLSFYSSGLTTSNAIVGCIVDTPTNSGVGKYLGGIGNAGTDSAWTGYVVDNIVFNPDFKGITIGTALQTNFVYNNTIYGCADIGFQLGGVSVVLKNNISDNNVGVDYNGVAGAGSDRNVSEDTTAKGTNPTKSANPTYVNEGAFDFHIIAANAFTGADLSADGSFAFNDDFERQTIATWRAGADAEAGAPGGGGVGGGSVSIGIRRRRRKSSIHR